MRHRPLLLAAVACCLLAHPCANTKAREAERDATYHHAILHQFSVRRLLDEGRYAEALEPAAEMLRIASQRADTSWMASAHQTIAALLMHLGQADSASNHAATAVRLSNSASGRSMCGSSLWMLR